MRKITAIPAQISELVSEVAQLKARLTALTETVVEVRKEAVLQSDVSRLNDKIDIVLGQSAPVSASVNAAWAPEDPFAYYRALNSLAVSAFDCDPLDHSHSSAHIRLRQLQSLQLNGTTIGIMSGPALAAGQSISRLNAADVHEHRLFGVSGPLEKLVWSRQGDLSSRALIPTGVPGLSAHLANVQWFWIPEARLTALLAFDRMFLDYLGFMCSVGCVIALDVAPSTILSTDRQSPFPSSDIRHFTIWNDNAFRQRMHRAGFLEIHRLGASGGAAKVTRFHESRGFVEVVQPHLEIVDDESVVELYLCLKMPSLAGSAP